jgi:hypothetical protein
LQEREKARRSMDSRMFRWGLTAEEAMWLRDLNFDAEARRG